VAQQQQFTEQRKPSQPAHNNQYGAVQQPAQQPARANRCYQVSIDVIYVLCAIVAMVARVRYLLGRNLAVLKFMTWCFMKFLPFSAGCRAGIGIGRKHIYLGSLEPELYSQYGSGFRYKKMKQTTHSTKK
jgi:hypothetical protein